MLQYGVRRKLDMMGVWDLPQELTWGYYLPHVKETRFGEVRGGFINNFCDLPSSAEITL